MLHAWCVFAAAHLERKERPRADIARPQHVILKVGRRQRLDKVRPRLPPVAVTLTVGTLLRLCKLGEVLVVGALAEGGKR